MCPNIPRPYRRLRQRQQGLGLVAAIFVITVMALIAVGMTNLTVTAQLSYANDIQAARAFLAAQSGLELEFNRLMPPASFPVGSNCLSNTPIDSPDSPYLLSGAGLGGCSARVTCQTISTASASVLVHRVESIGRCGSDADQVLRKVSAVFKTPK